MDQTAVAERVVAKVTVRVAPVVSWSRRQLGCRIASTAGVIGCARTVVVRAVDIAVVRPVLRANIRTVVVRLVGRTDLWTVAVVVRLVVRAVVDISVVWTVPVVNAALGADIAHMVVIVSSGVGVRVASGLGRLAVGRSIPAYSSVTV